MALDKLFWILKRHPFLYRTRFRLLSRNSNTEDIAACSYNQRNPKSDIPAYFHEINAEIFKEHKPATDLERVTQLAVWLKDHIKGGPGLSEPSEKALKTMLAGDGGVCSDMAQIFNNFCVINEIEVREWGTTSAPFDRTNGGHSFNEVYCKELQKWILIDVSWNILFYDANNKALSVVELYELSRSDHSVTYTSFNSESLVDATTISKNYLNAGITPFLICDYHNKTYDRVLNITRPYIPVFMSHFALYLVNRSYTYRFPLDDYKRIFA